MKRKQSVFVASAVGLIFSLFAINTGLKAYAQTQRKNEIKEETSFKRPKPSRRPTPEVPKVNRYQDDKVFLEYADSLYKIETRDTIQRQILKGNVQFRQSGLWMYCDSAYYYPEENSLDAFSNVRMEQGDTLFVYADQLYYDGDLHLAQLKNGPSRDKVTLINNDVTLTTDSLDYDMEEDLGWYERWGTIEDKVNTLTSLMGYYSPKTKLAEFYRDVVLVNDKEGYRVLTDTLYYTTDSHIAYIESPAEIQSENDTIFTSLATYYTDTRDVDLLSRSLIVHKDSTGNVITLEGDSIIYDNRTRISRAYMFQDPLKRSNPMVITDTAQKTTLIGGFGIYNDSTREALATMYPLLMEYSQGDTLFMRADTIKTFIVTEMVPDKKRKTKSGYPEYNGEPIIKIDSLGSIWIDSAFFATRLPFEGLPFSMLNKAAPPKQRDEQKLDQFVEELMQGNPGDSIDAFSLSQALNDELAVTKDELVSAESDADDEKTYEGVPREDTAAMPPPRFEAKIEDKEEDIETEDTISSAEDTDLDDREASGKLQEIRPMEKNEDEDLTDIDEPELVPDSIPMDFHVVLAYHRGRFFKQDIQGIADSIVFVERDSMLYMFRKPIIWSEERQVTGNRIDVHFNDSTTDWAYLPEFGLMSEHVDEDFYNQIYGKEIMSYFNGQGLRRMSVSGNVETIFLPQEEDSTYNRLVNAESSYMEVYLDSNKLEWLKMWPEVSGTVTPIFLVKRPQMYLQKFKWWSFLRPQREWHGDRWKWVDNLGEVPEELDQYFLAPSDFGEPKSFSGPRFIAPPSSLPIWEDFPEVTYMDSLNVNPSMADSLLITRDSIPIDADSLSTGQDSPAVMDVESTETYEDIVTSEHEEQESEDEIQQQSDAIVKEEENGYPADATIKEEEDE